MIYNILYSPQAREDLRQIRDYISSDLDNKPSAVKIVKRIIDRIEQLESLPETGTPLSSRIDVKTDYRYLVCGNYNVFYRVDGKNVHITRILHSRRNFMSVLFGE